MKKFSILVLLACFEYCPILQPSCLAQKQADAVRPPWIYVYGGVFMPNISTEVFIDSKELGTSTTYSLEDELNFPENPSEFYFKTIIGSRSQFVFSVLNVQREGDSYISRRVTFADSIFEAGTFVHAYFNTIYYSGTFRFPVLYRPAASVGLSIGMRWMNMSAGMNATSNGETISRDESIQVPVFLPGAYGSVQIIPSLFGRISAEYLKVNVNGTTAHALDAQVAGEYFFHHNVGAGIAYSIIDFKAENLPENDVSIRDVGYSLNGLSFFAVLRF